MTRTQTLTQEQIARAVRAGFFKAGADPERYRELVEAITADVEHALRPQQSARKLDTAA